MPTIKVLTVKESSELVDAIERIQRAPGCWCESGIGNPMVSGCNDNCIKLGKMEEMLKGKINHELGVR